MQSRKKIFSPPLVFAKFHEIQATTRKRRRLVSDQRHNFLNVTHSTTYIMCQYFKIVYSTMIELR